MSVHSLHTDDQQESDKGKSPDKMKHCPYVAPAMDWCIQQHLTKTGDKAKTEGRMVVDVLLGNHLVH